MVDWGELVKWGLVALNGVASIIWGVAYRNAKKAQIEALEQQVKTLETLNPHDLVDRYVGAVQIIRQTADIQIKEREQRVAELERKSLREAGERAAMNSELKRLRLEIDVLTSSRKEASEELSKVAQYVTFAGIVGGPPTRTWQLTGDGGFRLVERVSRLDQSGSGSQPPAAHS